MSRKGENIYKRKDGRWEGRYIFSYDANGKAKYKYIYAKSYYEVKERLLQAKTKSVPGSFSEYCDNSKYEYWLNEWLSKKGNAVKASTYIRYRNMVDNHIRPELGKYPISKISTALMEQFVNQKLKSGRLDDQGGISVKTMTDILVIIKESFKYAQGSGVSTICNFERICIKKSSHEMRVLSSSEEQRLVSVLLSDLNRYKLGVYLCLFTGIRIGELCALQWKHISVVDKTLKIESTVQRLQFEDKHSIQKTHIIITEPKDNSRSH